jgi:ferredoxin
MAHVVTPLCHQCRHTICVAVCPVDCFHEDAEMLVIDPYECIDCAACVPECPEEAIFKDTKVPPQHKDSIRLNRERSAVTPVIVHTKKPLMGRADCQGDPRDEEEQT